MTEWSSYSLVPDVLMFEGSALVGVYDKKDKTRQTPVQVMALWSPAPPPTTKLGVYRRLSTTAGVHVSPLQLGAMSIGESQQYASVIGQMDKESSFKLLDAYYDAGGNFIDTANS